MWEFLKSIYKIKLFTFNQKEHLQSLGFEPKRIRNYTDDELKKMLEANESLDLRILTGVCSEILRRKIN